MSEIELLPHRAVLRLSGADRFSFLQGLVTQNVASLSDGDAAFAALLTPQGKILFDLFVSASGDDVLIDCEKDAAKALLKRLSLYKLRAKVEIDTDDALQVFASETQFDGAFADPREAGLGWRGVLSNSAEQGEAAYRRRRIRLGVPEFGEDFESDSMFLTDVNYDMLNGVSYKKGCFIGQEVTSRMKRKGDIRRRTLIAEFDGPAPETGSPVTAGASTLGEILSGAGSVALAQIRMDRWEKAVSEGTPLECSGRELRLRIPDYLERA